MGRNKEDPKDELGRDTRNLVDLARAGALRPADFRDPEIATALEHIDKRRSILLVGPVEEDRGEPLTLLGHGPFPCRVDPSRPARPRPATPLVTLDPGPTLSVRIRRNTSRVFSRARLGYCMVNSNTVMAVSSQEFPSADLHAPVSLG